MIAVLFIWQQIGGVFDHTPIFQLTSVHILLDNVRYTLLMCICCMLNESIMKVCMPYC